jgi:uncharacterized protein
MDERMLAKLRRLGVSKGVRDLKSPAVPVRPAPPDPAPTDLDPPRPVEHLLPGIRREETAVGACYILDKVYPLTYRHGQDSLSDLLDYSPAPAARFTADPRLEELAFRDFLFLDTETTGLAGAGTLAFMVGVAFFEPGTTGDRFVVRQYFLRDHGDEPAMLRLLAELLAEKAGLVTFNGRSFDLPLLENRYLLNRLPADLRERPHLDLLPPARRLWRQRLGSCALGSLEQSLLGLQRTHEDVPGWLIPSLYANYLRSGDARELRRVFYHNQIDMVSMVTLAGRLMRQFAQPTPTDHPVDLYSLGKWQASLGLLDESEQTLRWAAQGDLPLQRYHQVLAELADLLKKNGRRAEALPLWQQIAATSYDDVTAHIELAKHYEWHEVDIPAALAWTDQAIALVQRWSPAQARLIQPELNHRRQRLAHKTSTTTPGESDHPAPPENPPHP